jgi:LPS export ABC transporter protein LptC
MSLKYPFLSISCSLLWILAACGSKQTTRDVSQTQTPRNESQLSFSGTTIEQSDERGNIIWKIKAKQVNYSPDRRTAELEGLTGDFYENGKIVLRVSAAKGEVEKEAKQIVLVEKVVMIDPRNRATIKSERVEWYPQKKLLIIPEKLTGERLDLKIEAQTGTYETKSQKLNLKGKIVADQPTNEQNSRLQLKTSELSWEIPQKQLIGDRPVEIWRYRENTIVDRLVGDRAKVSLQDNTATLTDNVILTSTEPNMRIDTDFVSWNYQSRLANVTKTVKIFDRTNDITIVGAGGQVDLNMSVATLRNGTQAVDRRQSSQIYANDLVWYFGRNTLEAMGNIQYRQEKPKMTLAGDRAIGNLKNNQITVTGDRGKQVKTKIVTE